MRYAQLTADVFSKSFATCAVNLTSERLGAQLSETRQACEMRSPIAHVAFDCTLKTSGTFLDLHEAFEI